MTSSYTDADMTETAEPRPKTPKKRAPRSRLARLKTLIEATQSLNSTLDLDELLGVILELATTNLRATHGTIYLIDHARNELWSRVLKAGKPVDIRLPIGTGIAGHVAATGETINVKDASKDERFYAGVDQKTGFRSRNMLCMPMRNRRMEIIGVFQVLNKQNAHFDKTDEDLLNAITANEGVAIENATLSTEMKVSFESFVKTLSSTIDARDPITAGHSERVDGDLRRNGHHRLDERPGPVGRAVIEKRLLHHTLARNDVSDSHFEMLLVDHFHRVVPGR